MKKIYMIFLLVFVLVDTNAQVPPNDVCTGAMIIPAEGPFPYLTPVVDKSFATTSTNEPINTCLSNASRGIWYSFTPASSGNYNISACQSDAALSTLNDNVIGVYTSATGCAGPFTQIACNDDACGTQAVVTNLPLLADSIYYILITSYNGIAGNVQLNIAQNLPAPPNDEVTGAILLTVNTSDECVIRKAGTTKSATASTAPTPSCYETGTNDDVWYKFVATSTTHMISVKNYSSYSIPLNAALYSGTPGNLSMVENLTCSAHMTLAIGLTAGTTYYIRTYTTNALTSTTADFEICVRTVPAPPANDEATGAIPLTVNADYSCVFKISGTTMSATRSTDSVPDCFPTDVDDDVWYSFVATNNEHSIYFSNVSLNRMYAALYTGTPGNLNFISGLCSWNELFAPGLTVGTTYYIRAYTVFGTIGSTTTFDICVGTAPVPPSNDEAAGAISLTVNANLSCAVKTAGTTAGATLSAGTALSCNTTSVNDDVWYRFVATNAAHTISFNNISNDRIKIALFTGTPGNLSYVTGTCANDILRATGLTVGTNYYVQICTISSNEALFANFDICVGTTPASPGNEESYTAITLNVNALPNCGYRTDGTTAGATHNSGSFSICDLGFTTSVWYQFTATHTSHVISLLNTFGDKVFIALYTNTPGTPTLVPGSCTFSSYTATGLTIGALYKVRVLMKSGVYTPFEEFTLCVRTPAQLQANDQASGAIEVVVGDDCPSFLYSNERASHTANEPTASCLLNTGSASTWFKFIAPASGAVRISTEQSNTEMENARMALFSATNVNDYSTFTIIGCDDDGGIPTGTGLNNVIYNTSLTPGATYYILVDKKSSTNGIGRFCVTVKEINAAMLSTNTDCNSGQISIGAQAGYKGWYSLVDNENKLIALVRNPIGGKVSDYSSSQNIHIGAVRETQDGTAYLNRNLRINNPTVNNVEVKFFFLASELAALNAVDGTTLANLGVSRQGYPYCNEDFAVSNSIPNVLPQTGNGTSADGQVNWITVSTPAFSNFYLHKVTSVLPVSLNYFNGAKQSASKNLLNWKLACSGNNMSIVLERSANQQDYVAIHSVDILNSNDCNLPFSFLDNAANAGVNYYRLKMVDADGRTSYSNIVALVNGSRAFELVSLAPNPVRQLTTITIASANIAKLNLKITDIAGKQISAQSINLVSGENKVELDFSKLAAGTYHITGVTSNGSIQTIRFVKQ